MQYFYHASLRNYTTALLSLFSHVTVPRYSSSGDRIEDIIVPLRFGNKDMAYTLAENENENLTNGNVFTLPRMAIGFNSLSKAQDRNTNKLSKINKKKTSEDPLDLLYSFQYNSVSYDFEFTLYIATKTFTDATIIIEQIAAMFNPDLTIKIQELDIQTEPTSIPVLLGDFAVDLPEIDPDEIKITQVEVPITMKGNLYLPIKDDKTVQALKINMLYTEQQRNAEAQAFGVDSIPDESSELNPTLEPK
ncbi:MAG: tail sheath stabilizer and completion protein [Sulfuricurvum sp.]